MVNNLFEMYAKPLYKKRFIITNLLLISNIFGILHTEVKPRMYLMSSNLIILLTSYIFYEVPQMRFYQKRTDYFKQTDNIVDLIQLLVCMVMFAIQAVIVSDDSDD